MQAATRPSCWCRGPRVEIDYVARLEGFNGERRVRERAPRVVLAGGKRLSVMHPLDCLRAKVANVVLIEKKRDEFGLAQARTAVKVARRYLVDIAATKQRVALAGIEEVIALAASRVGIDAYVTFDIDVIGAIPRLRRSGFSTFYARRLPQAARWLEEKRERRK